MIRPCHYQDFNAIYEIINEAAMAYSGYIPDDCYRQPYMSHQELHAEIEAGVLFWGWEDSGLLLGIMGIQKVQDVTLIRHAYVKANKQGKGIGGSLLSYLVTNASGNLLVGTWTAAQWAIGLYERYGFVKSSLTETELYLGKYWTISEQQKAASIVLVKRS
jgi:GNAT superfamily N-acetyltransferase